MSDIPFWMTRMGQRFFEGDVPRIAGALERIAKCLEAQEARTVTAAPDAPPDLVDALRDLIAELEDVDKEYDSGTVGEVLEALKSMVQR